MPNFGNPGRYCLWKRRSRTTSCWLGSTMCLDFWLACGCLSNEEGVPTDVISPCATATGSDLTDAKNDVWLTGIKGMYRASNTRNSDKWAAESQFQLSVDVKISTATARASSPDRWTDRHVEKCTGQSIPRQQRATSIQMDSKPIWEYVDIAREHIRTEKHQHGAEPKARQRSGKAQTVSPRCNQTC